MSRAIICVLDGHLSPGGHIAAVWVGFAVLCIYGCGDRWPMQETRAIVSMRKVCEAEDQYYAIHHTYAGLRSLGPKGANLVDKNIAGGRVGDYRLTLEITSTGYGLRALHDRSGQAGARTFYTDETKVIRFSTTTEMPNGQSPALR